MNDLFVPYELALKLKQFGFDELCLKKFYIQKNLMYHENASKLCIHISKHIDVSDQMVYIKSPTWDQAFDWFTNIDNIKWPIESWIQPYLSDQPRQYEAFYWQRGNTVSVGIFNTKQDARIALLNKLCFIYEENLR